MLQCDDSLFAWPPNVKEWGSGLSIMQHWLLSQHTCWFSPTFFLFTAASCLWFSSWRQCSQPSHLLLGNARWSNQTSGAPDLFSVRCLPLGFWPTCFL